MTTITSSDLMYTCNNTGISLFKLQGEICHTVYEGGDYQVFFTETRCGVFMKDEEKIYVLQEKVWFNMILKIECTYGKTISELKRG